MSYNQNLESAILQHLRNNIGRDFLIDTLVEEINTHYVDVSYIDEDLQDTLKVLHKEGIIVAQAEGTGFRDASNRYSKSPKIIMVGSLTKEGLKLIRNGKIINE